MVHIENNGPTDADLKAIEAEAEEPVPVHLDHPELAEVFRLPTVGRRVPGRPTLDYYDNRRYDPERP